MIWLEFGICATLILISGRLLSQFGDILADKTGMGRTWIGLILMATVSSLPELATGVSAVTLAAAPDIAVGNVLGACIFNLMLIGLIDLFYRPGPILSKVDQGHVLSAGFGILLIAIAAWDLLLGMQNILLWGLWIGPSAPLILVFYGIAVRMVFRFEQKRMASFVKAGVETLKYEEVPIKKVYQNVLFHAGIIVGAGIWLSFIGDRIAEVTGWGGTFVGSFLVAVSTTLPELAISFSAMKMGAPDLAIANLLGSNLFNMAILSIDDLVYVKGPLLSDVSSLHLFSAVTALMMTGISITGLIYRTQKKAWVTLSWDAIALMVFYLMNAYLLFNLS